MRPHRDKDIVIIAFGKGYIGGETVWSDLCGPRWKGAPGTKRATSRGTDVS